MHRLQKTNHISSNESLKIKWVSTFSFAIERKEWHSSNWFISQFLIDSHNHLNRIYNHFVILHRTIEIHLPAPSKYLWCVFDGKTRNSHKTTTKMTKKNVELDEIKCRRRGREFFYKYWRRNSFSTKQAKVLLLIVTLNLSSTNYKYIGKIVWICVCVCANIFIEKYSNYLIWTKQKFHLVAHIQLLFYLTQNLLLSLWHEQYFFIVFLLLLLLLDYSIRHDGHELWLWRFKSIHRLFG